MIKSLLGDTRRYLLNLLDSPAVILLYHRVTRLKTDPQQLSVSPGNFHEQVDLLKRKYALLEIEEFSDLIYRRKKLPKNSVIITFDDGYADNCQEALPILENLGGQALFYITTSNIDTSFELWWDSLERIFLDGAALPDLLEIGCGDKQLQLTTISREDRQRAYMQCHWLLKYTAPAERNAIIDTLLLKTGLTQEGRPSHRLMSSAELLRMGNSAAAVIGAHTHNHPVLSLLSYAGQAEEINRSREFLEKTLNRKIEHFSYPYGMKTDINEDSVRICRESGFKMVCLNYYGQVHTWSRPLQLPRILVRDWDGQMFERQLSKFFNY